MNEPTELLPCPFCGAGESQIHVNKGTWNGRGYGEPVSVEVRHWCADVTGRPSRMISRAGRDEESAIAAWNTRTPQPTQAQAGAVPLTDAQAQGLIELESWGGPDVKLYTAQAADSVLEDAARYRWLFGARTEAQSACVSETVFKPLPQDEVLSHLQGFYMSKPVVDALVDAARKQGASHD